ncbi:glycerophosphodiester phosphodiesterase family protein [Halomonas sp. Bachu 37]|uniref:glycerophosphodiester phosphodiesterase family protein n=1 Tax=Halomonas kashgarensis TaxID=3084920 RepID=UPI0032163481
MIHPAISLPRLIAHRGFSAQAPENTLSAVRAAKEANCSWVELDVQLLGDGTPVIWHDADVARCSDGRGALQDFNWASASKLDVGSWFGDSFNGERMVQLKTMLSLLDELDMGANLELKVNKGRDAIALVDRVIPMILDALPAERLVVSSFDLNALKRTRELAGPDRLALGSLFTSLPPDWAKRCQAVTAYSIHVHWPRLKRAQAQAMREAGYQVLCYTVNDPSAFEPHWAWGIKSAITDVPASFQRFLGDETTQ